MVHLIDKDCIAIEIEKKIKQYEDAFDNPSFASYEACLIAKGKYRKLKEVLAFINTLEVKEVDLDKEIINYIDDEDSCKSGKWTWNECNKMIRYFFELGLKTQKGE